MKVAGKDLLLQDLVPPIAYKLLGFIGVDIDYDPINELFIAGFLHGYSQYH